MSGGDPGDVQTTLNELERRLRELQAELASPGAQPPPAAAGPGVPPMPPYRPPVRPEAHEHAPAAAPPAAPPGGLQHQLDELLRFRDQLAAAAAMLVDEYARVLEQITRAIESAAQPAVAPAPPPTPASGHVTFPVPPPAAPSTEGALFSGPVVVDAGPFTDVATLATFEEALRGVPSAEHVDVRSFEDHRAVVDLRLGAEVPLVFELRRASDQPFDVEHADPGRLVLAMHSANLPFPMRPANEREVPPVPPSNGGDAD